MNWLLTKRAQETIGILGLAVTAVAAIKWIKNEISSSKEESENE